MELHNNRPTTDSSRLDSAREGAARSQASRASAMRAAVERLSQARAAQQEQVEEMNARTRARAARLTDSIEVSAAGRRITEESDAARTELIDSLRAAYTSGNLNTDERIERAARALLGGQ